MEKSASLIHTFLHWTEKWFKTDMTYLVKNGFWLTLGQAFSAGSALILSIAFAYFLTPEIYGTYKYILAICGTLAIFNLPGLGTAIVKATAQGKEGSFYKAFKISVTWGLVGGFISFLAGLYYTYFGNHLLAIPLFIGAVFLPIMDSLSLYSEVLQGKSDFKRFTKFFVASQVLTTICLLTTIFLTKNLYILIFAYFLSWTLVRFVFLKITLKIYPPNNVVDPGAIGYGKHLSLMKVLPSIASYLDKLLIFHFMGAAEVAIYSIATAPVDQLKGTLKSIYTLILPKFSQKSKEEIKQSIKEKMPKFILSLVIITVLYIIFIPFLLKLFFPKYGASIIFSQFYSISLIATAFLLPYASLEATASTKKLYHYNTWTSLMQILSLLILTPYIRWGFSLFSARLKHCS